jgi:hypothetical protein
MRQADSRRGKKSFRVWTAMLQGAAHLAQQPLIIETDVSCYSAHE